MTKKQSILITGVVLIVTVAGGLFCLRPFLDPSARADQSSFFLKALDLKNGEIHSGDIILWSTTSIKSLLVEEMTDGIYSHAGILYQDPEKELWVLDIYPEKGLRHMRLGDYLKDSKYPITRVAIFRYQFELDVQKLQESVNSIVRPDHKITFDEKITYNNAPLEAIYQKDSETSLYCTELVLKILEKAAGRPIQIENDFERVMTKWQMVTEGKLVNGLSPVTAVKKFYLKAKLGNLKRSPDKRLITPNGLSRSPDFKMIRSIEGTQKAGDLKKSIAEMPEIQPSANAPEVQK